MEKYSEYLVTKRFKSKTIFGEVNLPYGTVCTAKDGVIYCDQGALCAFNSDNFETYFTRNDDGNAVLRRKLIESIKKSLRRTEFNFESYKAKWDKVWNDNTCLKFKREEDDERFMWSYKFYNAEITELQYIAKLVGAKEVA